MERWRSQIPSALAAKEPNGASVKPDFASADAAVVESGSVAGALGGPRVAASQSVAGALRGPRSSSCSARERGRSIA